LGTDTTVAGTITSGATQEKKVAMTKVGTGTLTLAGPTYTWLGDTNINGGTLLLNGTHTIGTIFAPTTTTSYFVNSGGTLGGTGTINTPAVNTGMVVAAGGSLSPGSPATAPASTMTLNFGTGILDLTAITAGALKFDLGAPLTSDKIDLMTGTLDVGTLDFTDFAFTRLSGVTLGDYILFNAQSAISGMIGSGSGTFDGVTGTLSIDNTNFDVLFTVTAVTPMGLPGDHNLDGKVDAADYVLWRKDPNAYGGDPDGYNIWRANFGNPPGAGSNLDGGAAVPEPTASGIVLLAMAGAGMLAFRRR
jgi:autotransporter-associated beta strand protein